MSSARARAQKREIRPRDAAPRSQVYTHSTTSPSASSYLLLPKFGNSPLTLYIQPESSPASNSYRLPMPSIYTLSYSGVSENSMWIFFSRQTRLSASNADSPCVNETAVGASSSPLSGTRSAFSGSSRFMFSRIVSQRIATVQESSSFGFCACRMKKTHAATSTAASSSAGAVHRSGFLVCIFSSPVICTAFGQPRCA